MSIMSDILPDETDYFPEVSIPWAISQLDMQDTLETMLLDYHDGASAFDVLEPVYKAVLDAAHDHFYSNYEQDVIADMADQIRDRRKYEDV